jgi:hypothetical protein
MRLRWLALSLIALVALSSVGPARAQIPMIANGIIHATNASVNAANTTTETLLYQYPIPAALIASWTASNAAFASTPLHLVLNGTVQSTTGVTAHLGTLGVNLGSLTTASFVIANGTAIETGGVSNAVHIDVWISPIATVTTQNCTDLRPCNVSVYMAGRMGYGTAGVTAGTETVANGFVLGTAAMNQPLNLNVLWRWSGAASGNTLNIYNGVLKLGS